ncbi:MAG TPA: hypothetical protein DEP42_02020 [Ruminococcaceae bacterium]|nr:hypothetical protein [Oscillospiraceae bacterium]
MPINHLYPKVLGILRDNGVQETKSQKIAEEVMDLVHAPKVSSAHIDEHEISPTHNVKKINPPGTYPTIIR